MENYDKLSFLSGVGLTSVHQLNETVKRLKPETNNKVNYNNSKEANTLQQSQTDTNKTMQKRKNDYLDEQLNSIPTIDNKIKLRKNLLLKIPLCIIKNCSFVPKNDNSLKPEYVGFDYEKYCCTTLHEPTDNGDLKVLQSAKPGKTLKNPVLTRRSRFLKHQTKPCSIELIKLTLNDILNYKNLSNDTRLFLNNLELNEYKKRLRQDKSSPQNATHTNKQQQQQKQSLKSSIVCSSEVNETFPMEQIPIIDITDDDPIIRDETRNENDEIVMTNINEKQANKIIQDKAILPTLIPIKPKNNEQILPSKPTKVKDNRKMPKLIDTTLINQQQKPAKVRTPPPPLLTTTTTTTTTNSLITDVSPVMVPRLIPIDSITQQQQQLNHSTKKDQNLPKLTETSLLKNQHKSQEQKRVENSSLNGLLLDSTQPKQHHKTITTDVPPLKISETNYLTSILQEKNTPSVTYDKYIAVRKQQQQQQQHQINNGIHSNTSQLKQPTNNSAMFCQFFDLITNHQQQIIFESETTTTTTTNTIEYPNQQNKPSAFSRFIEKRREIAKLNKTSEVVQPSTQISSNQPQFNQPNNINDNIFTINNNNNASFTNNRYNDNTRSIDIIDLTIDDGDDDDDNDDDNERLNCELSNNNLFLKVNVNCC